MNEGAKGGQVNATEDGEVRDRMTDPLSAGTASDRASTLPAATPAGSPDATWPLSYSPQAVDLEDAPIDEDQPVGRPSYRPPADIPIKNGPADILAAWLALEVLSPQTFRTPEDLADGDRRRIAPLTPKLPWETDREPPPPRNTRPYFAIVLGAVRMLPAGESLLRVFGDTRPERGSPRDLAALAVIVVDGRGRVVEDDPCVAISSFGWALDRVRRGELRSLDRWPAEERRLSGELAKRLRRRDPEGAVSPVAADDLDAAFRWLTDAFGLRPSEVEPPGFAIRQYQWTAIDRAPDRLLLNSFFIGDIGWARSLVTAGQGGAALRRFVGALPPPAQVDVLADRSALATLVSPSVTPPARWPGPGRHSLVLLQQGAVNAAVSELREDGLVSVNGPPGTGKTTLLRDLVAAVLAQRAEALVRFDDPETAFVHRDKMRVLNAWVHLYALDDTLRGHEMLVASTNNKAVENVSRELPSLGQIAADLPPPIYFRTTSDAAAGGRETWGLIAAVLGNAGNRSAFYRCFWQDDDTSLKSWLKAAAGQAPVVTEDDGSTGRTLERPPSIIENDEPPAGKREALDRWRRARESYRQCEKAVRHDLEVLAGGERALGRLASSEAQLTGADQRLRASEARINEANKGLAALQKAEQTAAGDLAAARQAALVHGRAAPGWLARLFGTRRWRAWAGERAKLLTAEAQRASRQADIERQVAQGEAAASSAARELASARQALDLARAQLAEVQRPISAAREVAGTAFPDSQFWERAHSELHRSTPWLGTEVQRRRDELFKAAIELHMAFIGAAAKPIRHNLAALMQTFIGKSLGADRETHLRHLWSTLFLVTPVVSTTFASVARMLGPLPPQSIGWLFVDEAGQAVPQAAVGAMARARRAVVVGDPLQIEPVVTLPDRLCDAVARQFGVDPELWVAPKASVQTVADATGRFGAELERDDGSIRVGAPLLVHRRCAEPMFKISNRVAYNGLMVSATPERRSEIRDVLGPSRWLDVAGTAEAKWSPEEGAIVQGLLRSIAQAGIVAPDVYVISPFVQVARGLRELIQGDRALVQRLASDGETWRWLWERIGTVHTFQGKEAEAVIFVLGAPLPQHAGARNWAGGRPNIVNVAASRAKSVLYVVGSRSAWQGHGAFKTLHGLLP